MTPTDHARAECRTLARAMIALGRPATIDEICASSGLKREMVMRRLRGANSAAFVGLPAYFRFDKVPRLWRVTGRGVELVEGGK